MAGAGRSLGDDLGLLEELAAAVARPVWPLCLGRKAFVPGLPIPLRDGGLRPGQALDSALLTEPFSPVIAERLKMCESLRNA